MRPQALQPYQNLEQPESRREPGGCRGGWQDCRAYETELRDLRERFLTARFQRNLPEAHFRAGWIKVVRSVPSIDLIAKGSRRSDWVRKNVQSDCVLETNRSSMPECCRRASSARNLLPSAIYPGTAAATTPAVNPTATT